MTQWRGDCKRGVPTRGRPFNAEKSKTCSTEGAEFSPSKILTDSDSYWPGSFAADFYNRGLEKSIGQFDVTHNFKMSVVYDLPFGKGKPFRIKEKVRLDIRAEAFNVLNRVNDNYYIGNLSSPFFGQAVSASAPRRVQFSLRTRM